MTVQTAREWLHDAARGAGSRPYRAYDALIDLLDRCEFADGQHDGPEGTATLTTAYIRKCLDKSLGTQS